MKKKLLDLLAQKKSAVQAMRDADAKNDQTAFDAAAEKVSNLDTEIARVQAIIAAEEALPAPQPQDGTPIPAAGGQPPHNSTDCIHAFAECIRAQLRGDQATFAANAEIVRKAVRNEDAGALTEGTPASGGLIVPQDIQTQINELRRALNPLSELFSVENVSALSGSRVVDTHPVAGFTKLAEMGTIARDDKPAFVKIEFKVEDYALIVPVSNDLLDDTDQNLLAYLSGWFAKKGVITENKVLLTLLSALHTNATALASGKELAGIKKLLNVALDPAISLTSSFITNQDGFNYLDTLEDKQGRPLLQPDPTNGTVKMLLSRPVHVVSNAVLLGIAAKTGESATPAKAPIYIGDFMQYATLFRRKALEIAATNIGGNAWVTNSTEVRGIMRLDAKTFDSAAAVCGLLTLPA